MTGSNGSSPEENRCPCGGPVEYVVTYTDETHTTLDHEGYECVDCGREPDEQPHGAERDRPGRKA